MKKPFVLPGDRDRVEKVVGVEKIELPNGYSIRIRLERISHTGRSIYRQFDEKQVVIEIANRDGEPTKRLPIPASFSRKLTEKIEWLEGATN